MTPRAAGRILRGLVAAALTGYVLFRSDPREVGAALARADLSYVWLAVLLVLADRALMAWRWIGLLCIVDGPRPPLGRLVEIFFVSTFLGTFLPSSVGGDAVRAYRLSRERVGGSDAVASVFMDRMLGVASLLIVAVPGLLLAGDLATEPGPLLGLGLTAAVCAATTLIIFNARVAAWFARLAGAAPFGVVQRAGQGVVRSVQGYARHRGRLLNVLAASVGVQILRIVQAYALGRAVGIDAGPAPYFAFVPLILLVMLLPITINGLGTSQAAFVWSFGTVGVESAPAFALSLLFVALGTVGNLPGAILWAMGGAPPQTPTRDASARAGAWDLDR